MKILVDENNVSARSTILILSSVGAAWCYIVGNMPLLRS
jgi:hypothetical protein